MTTKNYLKSFVLGKVCQQGELLLRGFGLFFSRFVLWLFLCVPHQCKIPLVLIVIAFTL
jgi:hypothetical protein